MPTTSPRSPYFAACKLAQPASKPTPRLGLHRGQQHSCPCPKASLLQPALWGIRYGPAAPAGSSAPARTPQALGPHRGKRHSPHAPRLAFFAAGAMGYTVCPAAPAGSSALHACRKPCRKPQRAGVATCAPRWPRQNAQYLGQLFAIFACFIVFFDILRCNSMLQGWWLAARHVNRCARAWAPGRQVAKGGAGGKAGG